MQLFKGTGVALVTPFNEDGTIDFDGLERLINFNIEGGVEYLVSLGTTGEAATLTTEEKHQVLDFTVKTVNERVPVVAGFGGNNTAAVIENIKAYHFAGITAILSASPAYNKPTQEGIYQHYKAIAESTDLPIILYNVPGRTASNIEAETTLRLARDFENIIAVKEASGNLDQISTIIQKKPSSFLVISGDDALTLPLLSLGCDGVISVIANAFPREFSELVRYGLSGGFKSARGNHFKLLEMMRLIFKEGNPGGIKTALKHRDICGDQLRLPLYRISKALEKAIQAETDKITGRLVQ